MSSPQMWPILAGLDVKGVQVGERKARVSDMMAESIRPAMLAGTPPRRSPGRDLPEDGGGAAHGHVVEERGGSGLDGADAVVVDDLGHLGLLQALDRPAALVVVDEDDVLLLGGQRLGVLTRPLYLPSSSMTGKKRWRLEAMVFLASSTEVLTESLTMPSRCILALTGMDMQMRREAA